MFALWAALAIMRPRWRPPRSALLAALAAGLVAAALSASFGVGPELSWWSTYERMQGIVDAAHWAAFALVAASVVRTWADWMRLLNVHLGVGLAVSVLAILRYVAPELPLPMPLSEGYWPRVGASAGNPILLGAYLQAITLLAAGFLVRTCCAAAPPASAASPGRRRGARRRSGRKARPGAGDGWELRLFWTATAACALAGLSLTGSLGAFTGLVAGLGTACAMYVLLGRTRGARRLALAGIGALGALAVALIVAVALRGLGGEAPAPAFGNPMVERATSAERIGFTAGNRFRIWASGAKAFAERPLLGWGPENYFVASARHISAPPRGRRARVQYHAHNLALEEAVGKGVLGLGRLGRALGADRAGGAARCGQARGRAAACARDVRRCGVGGLVRARADRVLQRR